MNYSDPLMPAMHADTIRACGVGFGAHHFLPAHMGSRPVVVVETTLEATCGCCGGDLGQGERALRFSYGGGPSRMHTTYLHAKHCSRGGVATTPLAEIAAAAHPVERQPLAA